jgi:acetyltransferase-like isoleucine patch superfamily enzyme
MDNPYDCVYYTDKLMQYFPHVQFGPNCAIVNPALVELGENVVIGFNSSMFTVCDSEHSKKIVIGKGTQIGSYNSFAAMNNLIIGNYVLFASFVNITDHSHVYEDINNPIMFQGSTSKGPVIIEDNCWIGFGSHILSGIKIGKNSVIGANSVVTKNIPPYCVAAGSPAKIIKEYNFKSKSWKNVNSCKRFIFF